MSALLDTLTNMRADAWAALAAWVTAGIALVTVIVAGWFANKQVKAALGQIDAAHDAQRKQDEQAQVALATQARLAQETLEHEAREAQKTRDEQSQPNVVIYVEQNQAIWYALELVIKNFGATPAYDVRLSFDPVPMVSPHASGEQTASELWIPEVIPTLAPTQEWRTLWDYPTNDSSFLSYRLGMRPERRTPTAKERNTLQTLCSIGTACVAPRPSSSTPCTMWRNCLRSRTNTWTRSSRHCGHSVHPTRAYGHLGPTPRRNCGTARRQLRSVDAK